MLLQLLPAKRHDRFRKGLDPFAVPPAPAPDRLEHFVPEPADANPCQITEAMAKKPFL